MFAMTSTLHCVERGGVSAGMFRDKLKVSLFHSGSAHAHFSFTSTYGLLNLRIRSLSRKGSRITRNRAIHRATGVVSFVTSIVNVHSSVCVKGNGGCVRRIISTMARKGGSKVLRRGPALMGLRYSVSRPARTVTSVLRVVRRFNKIRGLGNGGLTVA